MMTKKEIGYVYFDKAMKKADSYVRNVNTIISQNHNYTSKKIETIYSRKSKSDINKSKSYFQ